MAVEKNRKYSVNTEKLLERVKKVYESGNSSRMEKIRKELTKAGDTESILTVGTSFLFGKNLPADRPQALAWLRLAAQNGNPDGQFHYAWMLDAGNTADAEGLSASSWYLKAASGGSRQAMFMLACACFTGQGMEQGEAHAKEGQSWKRKADLKDYEIHELIEEAYFCGSPAMVRRIREAFPYVGDVVGATMIGDAIENEIIRGQDHREAVTWYRTAAGMAVPGEQCLIAKQLEDGTGTSADLEEAIRCYEMAAEGGNTESMRLLGILGDEENWPEGKRAPVKSNEEVFDRAKEALDEGDAKSAVRIAMRLALDGMAQAQYMVARICEEGSGGMMKDADRALEWYRKSAEQNYAPACYRVAWYYDRGRVVREEPVAAFHWYHKAALSGSARAANHLGNAYMEGRGVRADREEAFRWYRTSADAGNAAAMYNLAVCFRDGEGTRQDLAQSLLWARLAMEKGSGKAPALIDTIIKTIKEAADEGEGQAALALGRAYEAGTGAGGREMEPDEDESLRWYRIAARSKEPCSLTILGKRSLEQGNIEEADDLFEQAAAAGSREAMFHLARSRKEAEGLLPRDAEEWELLNGKEQKQILEKAAEEIYSQALSLQLQKEYEKAFERFRFAALLGYPKACAHTGRLCRLGRGCTRDLEAALLWLKKANDAGLDTTLELFETAMQQEKYQDAAFWAKCYEEKHADGKAQLILLAKADEICSEGLKDREAHRERAAFVKFRQAARMGLSSAWLHAGEMYLEGHGVSQNSAKAAACFYKAGESGEQEARAGYVRLFYERNVPGLDAKKAFAWLKEGIAAAEPGETFSFGNYFVADETDHRWRILWRVLEKTEDEITAISEYCIDAVPWQDGAMQSQWAQSGLRRWLNHDFMMFAFSTQERILLRKMAIQTEPNPDYKTSGGAACYDRVSLLSIEEALRYFTPDGQNVSRHIAKDISQAPLPQGIEKAVWYDPGGYEAMAGATPFALLRGAPQEEETGGCSWWLRSPGCAGGEKETGYAACVMPAGEIYSAGAAVDDVKGLRPVIRISIRQGK